jgi:protein-S-isoprenylcysteine O-methyltransferase Ste14
MNLTILIAGIFVIAIFSWSYSVKAERYHGIPRFFSFLSIFVLFLLNYKMFPRDASGWNHILSWILLITGACSGIAGFLTLRNKGEAADSFENTTVLVRSAVYGYVRHPLYCSLLLTGTGIMFWLPGIPQIILGLTNAIALYLTAIIEEKEMISRFGDQYSEYMKETKMFIPFLF